MERTKQHSIKYDIPEGAVVMTKAEALLHQMTLILQWKPQSDVWPLVHGRGILAIAAGLGSFYINSLVRQKIKARGFGLLPSMITVTAAPSLLTGLFQSKFVLDKLLLLEDTCPLCLQLRSSMIQTSCGVLLPLLIAPVINFLVIGSGVHNMPHPHDIKKMFTITRSIYRPMIPTLLLIFTFQLLFSGFMTDLQIKSFLRMMDLQYIMEEEERAKRVKK